MRHSKQRAPLWILRFLLPVLPCILLSPLPARSQRRATNENTDRGNRGEIVVSVCDSSGEPISGAATVRLYRTGIPIDQAAAANGRVYFVLPTLDDYTVVVDAPGYKTAKKDVSAHVGVKVEVDVCLQPDSGSKDIAGVPGKPLLAPKAKEAFEKGLQALNAGRLEDAEKYVGEAMKLAPEHPDVLYVRGVLYLKRHNWTQAQSVLENATQVDPNQARAFAALGLALSNQGKYDAAIAPLEKSLQLDPAVGWETHWTLARAYYYHEQYEAALKLSQQALLESNGKAPQVELLVAQSLAAVGRYEDSAQAVREFLEKHADRPEAAAARLWLERLTASGKIRRD